MMAAVPRGHPSYLQMITEAVSSLKGRRGSSHQAIGKFMGDKYQSDLPPNFKRRLLLELKKLSLNGKLTKVKASYKLSDELRKRERAEGPATTSRAVRKTNPVKKALTRVKKALLPKRAPGRRRPPPAVNVVVVEAPPARRRRRRTAVRRKPSAVTKLKRAVKKVVKPTPRRRPPVQRRRKTYY